MKKVILFIMIFFVAGGVIASEMSIAMQFGLGYAPIMVIKKMNLIEKYAPGTKIRWTQLGSGAAINEALIAGKLDIGCMGVGPFLIGLDKGAPWKMASGLVVQPLGLQVNDPDIKSLKDIKPGQKIALPAPGSIQHILLAMAAEKELGNPRALDSNLVAMAHPDGARALISGTGGIVGHFTSPPYIFEEIKAENVHQIVDAFKAFGGTYTFLVVVATEKFHNNNPALYAAFIQALNEAIHLLNYNTKEMAELLAPEFGLDKDTVYEYMTWKGTNYTSTPYGIIGFAEFMKKVGYIRNVPESYDEIAWENVTAIVGKTRGEEKSPVESVQSR
ncbi:MAG: ABC transporter substrate-binding protein [Candidatus Heimdallarchaeaceae archaeon]